jgi:hypothetical protein
MPQTDIIGTGRQQPLIYPVMTEIAFSGLTLFMIKRDSLIGAGLQAHGAADTGLHVQDDQAVFSPGDGFHRTNLRTRRLIAMTAAIDLIDKSEFSVPPFGSIF